MVHAQVIWVYVNKIGNCKKCLRCKWWHAIALSHFITCISTFLWMTCPTPKQEKNSREGGWLSVHVLYLVSTLSGRIEKGFRIKHRVHLTLTVEPISSAFESAFELFESAFELGESAFELDSDLWLWNLREVLHRIMHFALQKIWRVPLTWGCLWPATVEPVSGRYGVKE